MPKQEVVDKIKDAFPLPWKAFQNIVHADGGAAITEINTGEGYDVDCAIAEIVANAVNERGLDADTVLAAAVCKTASPSGNGGSNPSQPTRKIVIVTDGSCLKNPGGAGGWACIIQFDNGDEHVIHGHDPSTTNNRMEITAAIEGLKYIAYIAEEKPEQVEIVTDSEYLKKGATEWMPAWKRRGWKTREKTDVLNRDLWETLDHLLAKRQVKWTWVRGHDKHDENNRCDELASKAARGEI